MSLFECVSFPCILCVYPTPAWDAFFLYRPWKEERNSIVRLTQVSVRVYFLPKKWIKKEKNCRLSMTRGSFSLSACLCFPFWSVGYKRGCEMHEVIYSEVEADIARKWDKGRVRTRRKRQRREQETSSHAFPFSNSAFRTASSSVWGEQDAFLPLSEPIVHSI